MSNIIPKNLKKNNRHSKKRGNGSISIFLKKKEMFPFFCVIIFMMILKIKWIAFLTYTIFFLPAAAFSNTREPAESIIYDITPLGYSQYQDLGLVEYEGSRANLVVFKTHAAGLHDTEKIYSDPQSYLPIKVERDVSFWFNKEYIIEEYKPLENSVVISKFNNGKKIQETVLKANGPIQNGVLLPFSLRKVPDLHIGWYCNIRLPLEFRVELVSIEDVVVPAGSFMAYHFKSEPRGFEVWITNDNERIPVKIKGLGAFSYTLLMRERSIKEGKN